MVCVPDFVCVLAAARAEELEADVVEGVRVLVVGRRGREACGRGSRIVCMHPAYCVSRGYGVVVFTGCLLGVLWFLAFVARECVSAVTGLLLGVDVGRDCESERRITEERGGER
jgi:hypothetical protein